MKDAVRRDDVRLNIGSDAEQRLFCLKCVKARVSAQLPCDLSFEIMFYARYERAVRKCEERAFEDARPPHDRGGHA